MEKDSPAKTVPVLVPTPVDRPFSYAVPEGMTVRPGSIVRVPIGPREVAAVVWDGEGEAVDPKKLRPLSEVFDCPPLGETARRFVDWVAGYTMTAPGMVARMFLRAPAAFEPEAPQPGFRFSGGEPDRMTAARRRVLEFAGDGMAWTRSGLAHAAGVSLTVIDGLAAQNVLEPVLLPPQP